eukprot:TRINITY_DN793_c0_g1_i3.p1 TRINITY_DN793_c0_g1~~TRINITY_DN793_c0_g1_i3.p1  ORF type:complete len:138 (+),score=7.34 TRINITY_DN793_c0_g1_i3:58-414(+)
MALRRTHVTMRLAGSPRRGRDRPDFPNIQHDRTMTVGPREAADRFNGNRNSFLRGHPNGIHERYSDMSGYMIMPSSSMRWPKYVMSRSRHGWTAHGDSDSYTTYKSLMEKCRPCLHRA